jgi:hypothetical protein
MHTLAAAGGRICTEHSAFNLETVVGLVAHGAGITPVVAHYGPAIQARHPIRHRPYSAAPRGRARRPDPRAASKARRRLSLAVAIGESSRDLIYILQWESLADRDKKFAAFQSDPERIEARRNREESGPL